MGRRPPHRSSGFTRGQQRPNQAAAVCEGNGSAPASTHERVKIDRREAVKLARWHRAGELRAVCVPNPPSHRSALTAIPVLNASVASCA